MHRASLPRSATVVGLASLVGGCGGSTATTTAEPLALTPGDAAQHIEIDRNLVDVLLGALAIVAVHLVAVVSVRLDLVDELSRIFGGE